MNDELEKLELERKLEDIIWKKVGKIHMLSLNGLISKPRKLSLGLFLSKCFCPKCGFELIKRKYWRSTSAGPIIYTVYSCECGYMYAK